MSKTNQWLMKQTWWNEEWLPGNPITQFQYEKNQKVTRQN